MHEYFAISVHFVVFYTDFNQNFRFFLLFGRYFLFLEADFLPADLAGVLATFFSAPTATSSFCSLSALGFTSGFTMLTSSRSNTNVEYGGI